MFRRALSLGAAVAAVAGFVFVASAVRAAEIKVLTSVALTAALNELVPQFEKASGDKVTVVYGLAAEMKKRVLEGESADVIMITRAMLDDLAKQNRVAAGSVVDVAGTPVSSRLSTWSFMSAINGEITTVRPGCATAGSW